MIDCSILLSDLQAITFWISTLIVDKNFLELVLINIEGQMIAKSMQFRKTKDNNEQNKKLERNQ